MAALFLFWLLIFLPVLFLVIVAFHAGAYLGELYHTLKLLITSK